VYTRSFGSWNTTLSACGFGALGIGATGARIPARCPAASSVIGGFA
jgi:hypothetical protein